MIVFYLFQVSSIFKLAASGSILHHIRDKVFYSYAYVLLQLLPYYTHYAFRSWVHSARDGEGGSETRDDLVVSALRT